jgi:serine/threonine-protein kinase
MRAGKLWSIPILAVPAVLGGLGTGCSATTPPTKSATTSVAPDLDAILLSADQINTVMGASGMQPGMIGQAPFQPTFTLSNPDCSGTLTVAENSVYAGSGYTAVREQKLQEPGDNRQHAVGQAAVSFPSADQASAFVKSSAAKWRACTGQNITQTAAHGTTVRWVVGNLSGADPRIVQGHSHTDPTDGWSCQHVLRAVSTIVLDSDACGYHITDAGNQLDDKMTANTKK